MAEGELDAKGTVEKLVQEAEKKRSSDIHLHISPPQAEIFYRIDGVLQSMQKLEDESVIRLANRIMYLAGLKTYQNDLPQEGRIAGDEFGIKGYIRVSVYPTVDGMRLALRLLNNETNVMELDHLKVGDIVVKKLKEYLNKPDGMLLLTGPSGSGKTTTIYACLKYLRDNGRRHIITIEDPVEYRLDGIMQTEIRKEAGLDFPDALKMLLRQDPEVIVIGEIRDSITARIAFQAALTGHKVISTVHAGSAQSVIMRLLDIEVDSFNIASTLDLVMGQRLCRAICRSCKGKGCDDCISTGFAGRVPIVELLRMPDEVRNLVRADATEEELQTGLSPFYSMTMRRSADLLIKDELTSEDEVIRVSGDLA